MGLLRGSPGDDVAVVFVCLGNICRSPAAEAVMGGLVAQAGLADRVTIDSAGTAGWHDGDRPDRRTRDEARRRGWPLDHRGRRFRTSDFDRFDLVLAMDHDNVADLVDLAAAGTDQRDRIHLLAEFDPTAEPGQIVPDPYYGDESDFAATFDRCERACAGLLEIVRSERGW